MTAEETQTLAVGKHRGKTFSQIYSDDPGYVAWVTTLDAVSGSLNAFKDYCLKRGPRGPAPIAKKRRSPAATDSLLDELEDLVNTPKRFKQSRFSEWLEEDLLTSVDTYTKGAEVPPAQTASLSDGLSDAFEFMDAAKNSQTVKDSQTSNRPSTQGWISTARDDSTVITLNENVTLEIVSPDNFRVKLCRRQLIPPE